jgi:hypothetical protein
MKTFTIDNDNNITAFPTPDHAEAAVGAGAQPFTSQKQLAELATPPRAPKRSVSISSISATLYVLSTSNSSSRACWRVIYCWSAPGQARMKASFGYPRMETLIRFPALCKRT